MTTVEERNLNIVRFPSRKSGLERPGLQAEVLRALARTATIATQVCTSSTLTKEDLRQALILLDLTNMHSRLLIDKIESDEVKQRLLADSAAIHEMIEVARRDVASLDVAGADRQRR